MTNHYEVFFHNLLNNICINHNTVDGLCILNNVWAQRKSNIGQLLHFGDPVIIFFEITRISCEFDMMKNGAPTELSEITLRNFYF